MLDFAQLALICGGALVLLSVPGLAVPGVTRGWLGKFPRSRAPAWILATIDLLWSGKLLYDTPLGRFEPLKPLLYVLVPVTIFLVIFFMDELLAPRALGGLFILIAAPVLDAARWNDSPLRLVAVVLMYAIVIEGITLVVSPYQFRRFVERFLGTDGLCRAWCGTICAMGLLVIALGLFAY